MPVVATIPERLQELGIVTIPLPTNFPVGPVNVYLLKNGPLTLVDTGVTSDESYEALASGMRAEGYAVADLERIIITHGHRDHMGQLGPLMKESGAESYGHPLIRAQGVAGVDDTLARRKFYVGILDEFGVPEEICGNANSLYTKFKRMTEPFEVTHSLNDDETVLDYEIYDMPGHSPSDTLLIDRAREFSIVGDHILTTIIPNPMLRRPENGAVREKALVDYIASLKKSRELDLNLCLPGHGPPFDNPGEVIDKILAKLEKRSETIFKLVAKGKNTPYRVSKRLFPKLQIQHIHLGLSIAVGHMEALEEEGRLRSYVDNGVLHFTPV